MQILRLLLFVYFFLGLIVKVLDRMVWHVVHFHISTTKVSKERHNISRGPVLDTELFKVNVFTMNSNVLRLRIE